MLKVLEGGCPACGRINRNHTWTCPERVTNADGCEKCGRLLDHYEGCPKTDPSYDNRTLFDTDNLAKWQLGQPRAPANPYADPQSPESQSINDPNNPFVQRASNTITGYKKECRDGGKGQKEGGD